MGITDDYTHKLSTNRSLKARWIGTTEFTINHNHDNGPKGDHGGSPNGNPPTHNAHGLLVKLIHDDAVMPARGSGHAAGFDITTVELATLQPGEHKLIRTGLAIACPNGT